MNICVVSKWYCTPNMKNWSSNASLFLTELSMLPNQMYENKLYLDTWRLRYDATLFCTKTMLTFQISIVCFVNKLGVYRTHVKITALPIYHLNDMRCHILGLIFDSFMTFTSYRDMLKCISFIFNAFCTKWIVNLYIVIVALEHFFIIW